MIVKVLMKYYKTLFKNDGSAFLMFVVSRSNKIITTSVSMLVLAIDSEFR